MTGSMGSYISEIDGVAKLEQELVACLCQTARTIEHMDCFDQEQRAEIYTILKALRDDTQVHSEAMGRWASERKEVADA